MDRSKFIANFTAPLLSSVVMLLLLLVLPMAAQAVETSQSCSQPQSTEDVLLCLETFHPNTRKIANDQKLVEGISKTASQFPNPLLLLETNKGKNLGDTVGEDTAVLSQLIEIGGKRSARKKAAEARTDAILANSSVLRAQTRMDALNNLVRYRQLLDEIAVLDEALTTYEKVLGQFSSRPRLTPEQEVTQGIFKLAMGDYRHRLAGLQSEKRTTEVYFKLVPELNFGAAVKLLPRRVSKWPKVVIPPTDLNQVLSVKIAETQVREAEAAQALAKANAVPDPTISLVAIREVSGPAEFQRIGAGISFPLPVFNLNGGARQEASALKTRAEIDLQMAQRSFQFQRENLVANYQNFVTALEKSPAPKDIDFKHRNTEALFYRGVISGVMVIEAHRQILDFTQSQNELELETVEALQSIYFLDGKLSEFKYE